MREALKHIYIHVPFCDGKCVYCGFYSEILEASSAGQYIEAVGKELDLQFSGRKPSPETIYFGGGTPSILPETLLTRLLRTVTEKVPVGDIREWTVEANPGTLPASRLELLAKAGVNRISIGAQSFNDMVLKNIGRRHSVKDIGDTMRAVRRAGIENAGLDLIACLPGVDGKMWRETVAEAVKLEPNHISVYSLSVETGTMLEKQVSEGTIIMPEDEIVLETLDVAEEMLAKEGYGRYEISNYARPGCECLHNLSFWRGGDYLGFGPSASSRDGLSRWTNREETSRYISALGAGVAPPREEEAVSPDTDAAERFVFAFRLAEGVDLACFKPADPDVPGKWKDVLGSLEGEGFVESRGDRWILTSRGKAMADHVAVELMAVS